MIIFSEIFNSLLELSHAFARWLILVLLDAPCIRPKEECPFEKRTITIPSPIDQVILQSIYDALGAIYDPLFRPESHGFRHKENAHSLLRRAQGCTGIKQIIRSDVIKCFDEVDHSILLEVLTQQIKDDHFLKLIQNFLKTPILGADETDY